MLDLNQIKDFQSNERVFFFFNKPAFRWEPRV